MVVALSFVIVVVAFAAATAAATDDYDDNDKDELLLPMVMVSLPPPSLSSVIEMMGWDGVESYFLPFQQLLSAISLPISISMTSNIVE